MAVAGNKNDSAANANRKYIMQQQFTASEPTDTYVPFVPPAEKLLDVDTLAGQVETQAVTSLLTVTRRKIRRRKVIFWIPFFLLGGGIFLDRMIADLPASLVVWLEVVRQSPLAFLYAISTPYPIIVGIAGLFYILCRPLGFNADELVRVGGVRAVPALLESLNSGTIPDQRRVIYRALTTLLPQMQASDAGLLTPFHHRTLNNLLKWGRRFLFDTRAETDLTLAILKAYEQVGDAKAIPVVENLANIRGRSERKRKIREAAQQCLPLLQSHTIPLDQNQTLLRAASQSKAAADVLLRPAAESMNVPAEELLRAASSETKTTP